MPFLLLLFFFLVMMDARTLSVKAPGSCTTSSDQKNMGHFEEQCSWFYLERTSYNTFELSAISPTILHTNIEISREFTLLPQTA